MAIPTKRLMNMALAILLQGIPAAWAQSFNSGNVEACASARCSTDRSGEPAVIRSETAPAAPAAQVVTPVAGPTAAQAPTEFEIFVHESLGKDLPVFGRSLFNMPSSFPAPSGIAAPSDYVVGPDDEILLRAWGKIDMDARLTVDRNGQIFIPRVGALSVAGLRYGQLAGVLRAAIERQFKDFELTATLGQLRSIQVFVLGQARRPGVYTISSLSTLVNALFASGGPTSAGSLRDIQVKRDGRVVTHLDTYDLLLQGDKSADVHLLPGDVIFIPQTGPRVAIDGDVSEPGIYELKLEGSTLANALKDAGGLTALAGTARALLEHVQDHAVRHMQELTLDAEGSKRSLADGDIVHIYPISPRIDNAVTLRGNVIAPGRYEWHAGMRVADLIPDRESLLTREYYNVQNRLGVAAPAAEGKLEERLPGVPNDVAIHDTEINWNHAVIERLDAGDLTKHLIGFVLGEAVLHHASIENRELQPGDVVIVYARKDLPLPQELQARYVRVDGQVKAPGLYRVEDGETLRDAVRRAGGLMPHAYLYASELTRESVRLEQEQRLHELAERIGREALSPANRGGLSDKSDVGSSDLALRQAYLAKLNDIHPTGRIVLGLKPGGSTIDDVPKFRLQDGDHYFVPALPNTVDVLGNVYNQGAMRYVAGQHAGLYLDAAGGATRDGDRRREFILRADGTLVSRQQVARLERLEIYPGDAVIVPPQLRLRSNGAVWIGAAQILSSFALSSLAIRALE